MALLQSICCVAEFRAASDVASDVSMTSSTYMDRFARLWRITEDDAEMSDVELVLEAFEAAVAAIATHSLTADAKALS